MIFCANGLRLHKTCRHKEGRKINFPAFLLVGTPGLEPGTSAM